MIQVLWKDQGDGQTLQVTGHAGSAPAGEDLICAGMTALVYALGQTLEDRSERLTRMPDIQLSPGFARIRVRAKPGCRDLVREDFALVYHGAQLLAAHYPECVAVL